MHWSRRSFKLEISRRKYPINSNIMKTLPITEIIVKDSLTFPEYKLNLRCNRDGYGIGIQLTLQI